MKGKIVSWENQDGDTWYCWEIEHEQSGAFSEGDWETYQEAWDDLNSLVTALSRWGIEMPSMEKKDE